MAAIKFVIVNHALSNSSIILYYIILKATILYYIIIYYIVLYYNSSVTDCYNIQHYSLNFGKVFED